MLNVKKGFRILANLGTLSIALETINLMNYENIIDEFTAVKVKKIKFEY